MFIVDRKAFANVPAVHANGLTVADVDGDGVFEVLVAVERGANLALKWTGDAFVDVADAALADAGGSARGFLAADLDGDGREEVYLLNGTDPATGEACRDRLFAAFGKRWMDLLDLPENAGNRGLLVGGAALAIDRHGRGRYGFLIVGDGAPCQLLELGGRGYLVDNAEEAGLDLTADARAAVNLPLTSAAMNVFIGVADGPNRLYVNIGDGGFEEVAAERAVADLRGPAGAAAVFDADGDGLFDLLVAGPEGPQRLFLQRMGIPFVEGAGPDFSDPLGVNGVVIADFDNDGFEEMFIRSREGRNHLFAWRNDEWREEELGDALKGGQGGAVVADVDGDGRLELILSNGPTAAPLSLLRAAQNTHGWIRVAPLTAHGAPARGAVVTCVTDERRQSRVICAGSGRLCQMEPVAHFGLGDERAVVRVEVRWPDGMAAVIEAPPINRAITVPHPPE